jgi:hypothetical protein
MDVISGATALPECFAMKTSSAPLLTIGMPKLIPTLACPVE